MSFVFGTLTYPHSQRPVRGQVRVRPVTDVVLDDEQREVVQGSSSVQLVDGVYVLDLDVLPDGYYHLITHPDGETLTVVVPPGEPPHDDAHKVPGTVSDYGWWVQSIRVDNPATPPAVTVGVVSVTGDGVDNTDPRNPVITGGTGGGAVSSVFTRAGDVVAEAGDYAAFYDPLHAADDALTDAEDYADGLIAAEQTARAGDVTTLANLITAEAGTRAAGDTANATAIANEITRAQGVEAAKADLVAGKVPTSQLPALAVNEVFPVASQAAMLALTAQRGDIARRTDFTPNHLYLLTTDSPATLSDWLLIVSDPGAGVDTVNGQSGTVVLGAADVGADTAAARDTAIANQHTTDVSLFQALDPDLTTIAGLDSTQAGVVASDGTGWFRKSYAQLKTALGLVKADVGLGSVDNTADASKPVSTAQAAYADGKVIDSIADADTTHAPSRNAVFDALALKADATGLAAKAPLLIPTGPKTVAYNAVVRDLAMMNVPGGGVTLNLPAAPADGSLIGFVAIGATTAVPLTINRGGADTIGTSGSTSVTVPLSGEVVVYQYDSANTRWLAIANVKSLTAIDARYSVIGKRKAGRIYGATRATGGGFLAYSNGLAIALPFPVANACTLLKMGLGLGTAGSTGSVIRLGIYSDDGAGMPGTLLVDGGTINGTLGSTHQTVTVSQALAPGLYWVVVVPQGAPTTNPTMQTATGAPFAAEYIGADSHDKVHNGSPYGAYATAAGAATGVLPGSFPAIASGGPIANFPTVSLEIS